MSNIRNLLAAALLASAGNAVAASSVDLAVKGTITPSACTATLSDSGEYDLGKIAAKDLHIDMPTDLPELISQMTLTCEAPTLVAIESKDNRAGSSYYDEANSFGLGKINGTQRLGVLFLFIPSQVADGAAAYGIHSMDGGVTWATGGNLRPGNLVSTYKGGTTTPIPVQVLTSKITIRGQIAPANSLTLDNEAPIDGSITLTVLYL